MDASDNDSGLFGPAASASLSDRFANTKDLTNMTGQSTAPAKHRVLVVEDEMLIGMLLEDMLTDLGHEVAAIVPRLKEAMAAVERETYDFGSADREGGAFRVRHRLRRARPAGKLSRAAGVAEALRQGRP
jgi:hypothetical protein